MNTMCCINTPKSNRHDWKHCRQGTTSTLLIAGSLATAAALTELRLTAGQPQTPRESFDVLTRHTHADGNFGLMSMMTGNTEGVIHDT